MSSPSVPRDEDVDDLAVALEEREEVVGRGACEAKESEEEEAISEMGRAPALVRARVKARSRKLMLRTRSEKVSRMSGGPDLPKCDIAAPPPPTSRV